MAFSWVQSTQTTGTAVTSVAVTISAAGVNNLVVVHLKFFSSAIPAGLTVTDNAGNTYANTGVTVSDPTVSNTQQQWYGVQVTGGATIVTASWTGTKTLRMGVEEFSGNASSNAAVFDKAATNNGNGTTGTITIAPNASGNLVDAFYGVSGAGAFTAGTNYTAGTTASSGDSEYRLSATTSETVPASWVTTNNWCAIAGSYKPSTGGGGSTGGGSDAFRAVTESGYAAAGSLGGALDTLKVASETARGTVGAVAGAKDTFKPLFESGGGTVFVNVTASGIETFQRLLESASGLAGAKGFASATLRHLTESATGAIGSNAVIGYALDTFKPIAESGSAKAGAMASAADVFRALNETGTGEAGALGFGFDALRPFGSTAFGASGAAPIAPSAQPSGFAWWGMSTSSFFHRTLDDKARELERLRLLRVDLGILPKENREILQVIRQVEKFVENKPKPTPAVIAKADDYNERLEKLLARMDEEILDDDDEVIVQMSRFFFNSKEPSWKHL